MYIRSYNNNNTFPDKQVLNLRVTKLAQTPRDNWSPLHRSALDFAIGILLYECANAHWAHAKMKLF